MLHPVSILALVALALVRAWGLWRDRPVPLWRLSIDTCIITLCIAFPLMWDRGRTGGQVGDIGFAVMTLGFAIQLVTATSARIYSKTFRHPSTRLSDCRALLIEGGLFLVLLVGSWLASPLIHSRGALDAYAGPHPLSVALYKIAAWGWVITALLDVGIVSLLAIRRTSRISWPGLVTISAAFLLAAQRLLIELATILPGSDPHWYREGLDQQPPAAILLVVGLGLLFTLPRARDHLETRSALRTLTPLWRHVTERHPQVVLPLARAEQDQRLARHAIEIRDALVLTPTRLDPGAGLEDIADELLQPAPPPTGRSVADLLPEPPDTRADLDELLRLSEALHRHTRTKES